MTTRECKRCHTQKDIDEFGFRKLSKDGRNTWCKQCMREYQRVYYDENKNIVVRKHQAHATLSPVPLTKKQQQKVTKMLAYLESLPPELLAELKATSK